MTDERERSDAGREPERVKVTDRRRFAGAEGAEEAPSAPPVSDEVALVKAQAEEYLGHLQRLQAEFDNFRKRAIKEQTRSVELASRPVMERLIEVLDDFEMALTPARNEEAPADGFRKGMELLYAKLLDALRAEGLERIEAEGRPFDPNEHEALLQTGDGDGDPVVVEVLRHGYRLRGTVIRPASVRVERRG